MEDKYSSFPKRKQNRIENYDYSTPGAYFITICTANREQIFWSPVGAVVGSMKRWVSKQIGRPIWQKSFYEHAIRNRQDYDEIWKYIENNPLKYLL